MTEYDLGKVVGDDGDKGDTGNGIASIIKTGTSGKVDTYTITYTDGTTSTFTVTNGDDATVTIITGWTGASDSNVASAKLAKTTLDTKITKSSTTGLMKNDGTVDTNSYLTVSSASSTYVAQSDIANNLTTTTSGKVLDARQGKALADLIGDSIEYINL